MPIDSSRLVVQLVATGLAAPQDLGRDLVLPKVAGWSVSRRVHPTGNTRKRCRVFTAGTPGEISLSHTTIIRGMKVTQNRINT